ncbi:hypothetical protein [Pseudaminobacter sp. NGMCC 1.201702]|uniref:hypothetical protein n=1 Tax=Pseudaminobacter sp. NGMCC 1.201702 TaxID=3391825 RepID=UPI0039EFB095
MSNQHPKTPSLPTRNCAKLGKRSLALMGFTAMDENKRETVARALCRQAGNAENTMFMGLPMWKSYLSEADALLQSGEADDILERHASEGASGGGIELSRYVRFQVRDCEKAPDE